MFKFVSGWFVLVVLFLAQPAFSQGNSSRQDGLFFNPDLATDLTYPSTFAGLYAGISLGLSNNNFDTFYTSSSTTYRIPVGVFAGYNYQVQPWLLAGAEVQGEIAFDPTTGASDVRLLALGRLGFPVSDDFILYQTAGLGVINGRSAYALGLGVEQSFSKNFAVRSEIVAYGQLFAPVGVTDYGGFTLMKIVTGALWRFDDNSGGTLANLPTAGVLDVTDFSGPYLGAYAGVEVNTPYNFFVYTPLNGYHLSRVAQGGIAGWNYPLNDWLRTGVELQAGVNYNTSGGVAFDAEALARIGAIPIEGLLVYATAGVGVLAGRPTYNIGGGVEYALWGKNTLRLDGQLIGEISPAPPVNAAGLTASKVTIGTIWHLK